MNMLFSVIEFVKEKIKYTGKQSKSCNVINAKCTKKEVQLKINNYTKKNINKYHSVTQITQKT